MTYYKFYKDDLDNVFEITKEEAKHTLEGWWKKEALDEIFNEGKSFRLYTPYAEVWTKNDKGMVAMAGFYGIVG